PDYPATLPLPDHGTYAGSVDQGLIRTTVPSAQANQIYGFNSPRVDISMTFKMVNDKYAEWLTWVKANAFDWFNMPVISPATPTDITSVQSVRFTSDIQYTKLGDNWLSVTVACELIPGDYS
ncbi:unnamed protein product, partial [marine sediment metagenome]